ncbi:MAG: hypothetical protein HPY57_15490 [Ignavibacteria bacterium]|nr:hypothetical protein [Ignavibacteria bacterium]
MRQPIIFHVCLGYGASQSDIDSMSYNLNENHRHLIDGYEFVYYVSCSLDKNNKKSTIECVYPIYKGDDELIKLHKENLKMLNQILKQKLKNKEKKDISILRRILREFKLERLNKNV